MLINNPQTFWDWFLKNKEKFNDPSRLTKEQKQYWSGRIRSTLGLYCIGSLFHEMIMDDQCKLVRMIFSAHGNIRHFHQVASLVDCAPVIEGWEFIAFYPPMPAEDCMFHNYPSVTTRLDEMLFSPLELVPVNDCYDLTLYVDENAAMTNELRPAATQMMYNLLGEKKGGLCIRKVAVSNLGTASLPVRQSLLPMTELPLHIKTEGVSSTLVVGAKGRMKSNGRK